MMMDIGAAISAMKHGKKVAREGWNGKGMFVYYVPPGIYDTTTDAAKEEFGKYVTYEAYVAMKTVKGTVVPWLASQTDILANDWRIVE
jgi:hypothetical protein